MVQKTTIHPKKHLGLKSKMIEFATRDTDGNVWDHKTLEEALEAFTGPKGYRLDIILDNKSIYIRRDSGSKKKELFSTLTFTDYESLVSIIERTQLRLVSNE